MRANLRDKKRTEKNWEKKAKKGGCRKWGIFDMFLGTTKLRNATKLKAKQRVRESKIDSANGVMCKLRRACAWIFFEDFKEFKHSRQNLYFRTENLILVQTERWRRGWDMQVERKREQSLFSGERVSNVWAIYLLPRNNGWKRPLIPDEVEIRHLISINGGDPERGLAVREELIRYQLVGEVTAYQG